MAKVIVFASRQLIFGCSALALVVTFARVNALTPPYNVTSPMKFPASLIWSCRKTRLSTTGLFNTNDPSRSNKGQPQQPRVMTIPVLGPVPGARPLMVGEDFVVEEPTSTQWNILQEALHNHRAYLKEVETFSGANSSSGPASGETTTGPAGIDAAPLVAFMDDITSLAPIEGDKKNSKYATIAAVVGISPSRDGNNEQTLNNVIDTSSNTGFMESIMRVFQPDARDVVRPLESKIRLVGIGRAALSDFHSRLPSTFYDENLDDDGYINLLSPHQPDLDGEGDENTQEMNEAPTPIVLAQFRLLTDSSARSEAFVNTFGRSNHASPVHALNEMNSLANRITSLHEDRKRLLRGLSAAKARLSVASMNEDSSLILEDHDGLGMLSSGYEESTMTFTSISVPASGQATAEQVQEDIDTLLNHFPGDTEVQRDSFMSSSMGHDNHKRLLGMENYGMGISSASFSHIPGLTKTLAEKLQPYYSPKKQESEEHYYEVFSFMGALSLSKFVQPKDLDWALKSTNTIERMQWVYDWMWSHKRVMRDASEEVSSELRDCGEECTDLW